MMPWPDVVRDLDPFGTKRNSVKAHHSCSLCTTASALETVGAREAFFFVALASVRRGHFAICSKYSIRTWMSFLSEHVLGR